MSWSAALHGASAIVVSLFIIACSASSGTAESPTPDASEASSAPSDHSQGTGSIVLRFEGCSRTTKGENTVEIDCGGLNLAVVRMPVDDSLLYLNALPSNEWRRQDIVLDGKTLSGSMFTKEGRVLGIAVLSDHGQQARFVRCFWHPDLEAGQDLCRERIANLVLHDGLAAVSFPSTTMRIGTADLQIPNGCSLTDQQRISCATAELHFREGVSSCRASAQQARDGFVRTLKSLGTVSESTQECIVFDRSQMCTRFETDLGDRRVLTIVNTFDCKEPMVQCNLSLPSPSAFPPPCDQIFKGTP